MCISIVDILIKIISLGFVIFGSVIAYKTLKKNHEWNRRKSTQEVLKVLVLGDYPKFSKTLLDYDIKPFSKDESFNTTLPQIGDEKIKNEIIYATKSIFNLFEFIAINIKNNTIDENICYDYLGWMYVEYYRWGKDYISQEQQKGNDERILGNFSELAEKWTGRLRGERKPAKINGSKKI